MQAVPSLVGTGTVVAAAATGLVFAQPADDSTPQRPASTRPNLSSDFDSHPRSSPAPRPSAASFSHAVTHAGATATENRGYSDFDDTTATRARPATAFVPSTSATLPRSTMATHITAQRSSSRRHSFIHKGEWMPPPISEVSRDSVSSNGSWMRRLSIRPLSQHGSIRSSVGPGSPSINFSLGSAAPIFSSSAPPSQPQPRNKLVKRTTAGQEGNAVSLSRRGSRSQMPTLRRPATSHQRSATFPQLSPADSAGSGNYSFDHMIRPDLAGLQSGAASPEPADLDGQDGRLPVCDAEDGPSTRWVSFFHQRLSRTATAFRGSSPFSHEGSPIHPGHHPFSFPSRTVQVQQGNSSPRVYLADAAALREGPSASPYTSSSPVTGRETGPTVGGREAGGSPKENSSPQDTPSKLVRRSISMHFASPTSWISRTGSLRRPKRGSDYSTSTNTSGSTRNRPNIMANGRRHVSAPLSSSQRQVQLQPRSVTTPADMHLRKSLEGIFDHPVQSMNDSQDVAVRASSPLSPSYSDARAVRRRQRNSSSPLPPLSRLSSFNVDVSRLGASASSPAVIAAAQKQGLASGSASFVNMPRAFPLVPRSRDVSNERPSTFSGSELEMRGFMSSGDDDDTDFKSDTMFDSVRTAASARVRTTDTPIESMFDESPPSTASNGKTKRLSIQEILGQTWDSDTRIMEEEDEGISTPIRRVNICSPSPTLSSHRHNDGAAHNGPADSLALPSTDEEDATPGFPHARRQMGFGRMSMDDEDDDDDWARVDENGVANNLSPPSRSLNNSLRGLSGFQYNGDDNDSPYADHRSALSVISGNGSPETLQVDDGMVGERERPRSNLFDWSESTVNLEKIDPDGHSPRPKTVHGKQEMDLRNGRPMNRKGPTVAHVRSQSVPAIADPTDGAKSNTSKFGTWATGPKNASEDWDDDFDFETSDSGDNSDDGFGDFGGGDGTHKGSGASFAMVVPASIQATQPTVRAHSGQIRELSLLVDGLKRLCRHARDLEIVNESPGLWREAENIIALASPDDDFEVAADRPSRPADAVSHRTSTEFDSSDVEDRFVDEGFDAGTLNSFGEDSLGMPDIPKAPATPPNFEIGKTTVVRERQTVRRRSVFSPDDDIFGGGWPLSDEKMHEATDQQEQEQQQQKQRQQQQLKEQLKQQRPQTPDRPTPTVETPDSAMIESIMKAMQQQRSSSAPIKKSPVKHTSAELFFNTNTLQELVKRANSLFHTLSDLVRRAELITQSPACTPRHDRHHLREDGSPAFTRVFTDPSSPPRRLPKSQSTNSVLSRQSPSVESPNTNGISQRLQMMRVN